MQSRISVSLAPRSAVAIQGRPPLFLDQETGPPPPLSKGLMTASSPPPLYPALEWRENCDRLSRNLAVTELREVVT